MYGYLIVNLGSPDSTKVSDVRKYLDEFLMDKYVLDFSAFLRFLVVKCFILPFRPKKSAAAYQSIWWDEGSPLIILSKRLLEKLKKKIKEPISLGMRYGNPSIRAGIDDLLSQNPKLTHIHLVPLYPHYAMATTITVIEKTKKVLNKYYPNLTFSYIESFYQHPAYIKVLTKSIQEYWEKGNLDHIIFSFHGVPERHVQKTDPSKKHCMKIDNCCYKNNDIQRHCYAHHCKKTAHLVIEKLGLKEHEYSISFQSRLGPIPWLKPYTDKTIEELAHKGVKKLGVACPAFVSDCLETLEEIGEEGDEDFQANGGEKLTLIPCLNERDDWVDVLSSIITDKKLYIQENPIYI